MLEVKIADIALVDWRKRSLPLSNLLKNNIREINFADTETVVAGENKEFEIKATKDYSGVIKQMFLQINRPPNSTTGTHSLEIRFGSLKSLAITVTTTHNSTLRITNNSLGNNVTSAPSDVNLFKEVFRDLVFTDAMPIYFRYINNTDVPQTETAVIRLLVFEEAL